MTSPEFRIISAGPTAPEFRPCLPSLLRAWPTWQSRVEHRITAVEVVRHPGSPGGLLSRPLDSPPSDPFLPFLLGEGEGLLRPIRISETGAQPLEWEELAKNISPGAIRSWHEAPEIPFRRGLPDPFLLGAWDAWHPRSQMGPHECGLWERKLPHGGEETEVVRLRVFAGIRVDLARSAASGSSTVPGEPLFTDLEASSWRPLVLTGYSSFPRPVPWEAFETIPGGIVGDDARRSWASSIGDPSFRSYLLKRLPPGPPERSPELVAFDAWWNSNNLSTDNPFEKGTPAYWALEGWRAKERALSNKAPPTPPQVSSPPLRLRNFGDGPVDVGTDEVW